MFEKSLRIAKLTMTVVVGAVSAAYTIKWFKELDDCFHGRSKTKTEKTKNGRDKSNEIPTCFVD